MCSGIANPSNPVSGFGRTLRILSGIAILQHQQIIYNLPHILRDTSLFGKKLPHQMLEDL